MLNTFSLVDQYESILTLVFLFFTVVLVIKRKRRRKVSCLTPFHFLRLKLYSNSV